ncbi:MAG: LysR family transcriptional regulator [Pseudomonadota bacterium]
MRHLRIYRAIRLTRREGSIRKAAEHLAISPSALNRAIQSFEDELEITVFDRIPGGVRLTAAGELLADLVERHLVEFEDLQGVLGRLHGGRMGTLRLSFGSDIGAGALLTILAEFEAANPAISLDVTMADTTDALRRHETDLAILTNPATDETVEVLYSTPVPLSAWTAAPAPQSTALWQLMDRRLVLPPQGTGSRTAIAHLLRRHRLDPATTSTLAASHLPLATAGEDVVCICPDLVMERGERHRRLHRVPLPIGTVHLCVLRAARMPIARQAQAFINTLQRGLDRRMAPANAHSAGA